MDPPSTSTRELARLLLAIEAEAGGTSAQGADATARVLEKLRLSLTKMAGAEGFRSLIRRSLALARKENPALQSVTVKGDGSIKGAGEHGAFSGDVGDDAALVLTTHLLGLLVTFIGDPLTRRLVREIWPDAAN